LISFEIIKRTEFNERQIRAKQIFYPIHRGLIVLKNEVMGFTLIILSIYPDMILNSGPS